MPGFLKKINFDIVNFCLTLSSVILLVGVAYLYASKSGHFDGEHLINVDFRNANYSRSLNDINTTELIEIASPANILDSISSTGQIDLITTPDVLEIFTTTEEAGFINSTAKSNILNATDQGYFIDPEYDVALP